MLPADTETLILTRRDIAQLMTPADYLAAADAAFRALATGTCVAPAPLHIHASSGGFHGKAASLAGERPVAAIKWNGNFPGNRDRGLPTIQGALLLSDAVNGRLLAVMDSIEITLRRTAAASALAARHLARGNSSHIAICGCGGQAAAQLEAIAAVFAPSDVTAWDRDPARSDSFVRDTRKRFPARAVATVDEAAHDADIVVTCTTATEPFLAPEHVRPGAFIAAVGADNPDKSEIVPALMARAKVVADVLEQCAAMGDLRHALGAGVMTRADVWAELGDIVTRRRPGRTGDDEIIIFDSTGTAAQDVAAAIQVYDRATASGAGMRLALGAP